MQKRLISGLTATLLALGLAGCGDEAGERLLFVSVTDTSGCSTPIYNAVEKTNDYGIDNLPNTEDPGEGDGFPDTKEAVLDGFGLGDDLAKFTLFNEARQGVDPAVDLYLTEFRLTYSDANGQSRDFAPAQSVRVNQRVPVDSEVEVSGVLIPLDMKIVEGGLRDIFLYGTPDEIEAASTWTVSVQARARDIPNDEEVKRTARITVRFINPMTTEAQSCSQ